ncbi:DUF4234 domain-containing protein [Skermania sp. ID1734]|uniref:DUF4234 domain-containing protein n=1 Tax=Skermania sp. ID1734 TaxID=2597516 RepID=UPI00117D784B|nr:DUF4234 domain-containing protein [Skermania sp. ID1734]TSE01824.1 DUF4234 domain-containing protein [Skermania sp. ID1734]
MTYQTQFAQPQFANPIKYRNPILTWFVWPLITLGIYHLVWYYKIHREMRDRTGDPNAPVAGPMLVMLFLGWTFIAPLISYYRTGNRIKTTQAQVGVQPTCSPIIGLLLFFVFGLSVLYYQIELNKIAAPH